MLFSAKFEGSSYLGEYINRDSISKLIRGNRVFLVEHNSFTIVDKRVKVALQSTLGSSIGIALFLDNNHFQALGHFIFCDKYSELLFSKMVEEMLDISQSKLSAKIFGASNIGLDERFSKQNIETILELAKKYDIEIKNPITPTHLLSVMLLLDDGSTLLRSINNNILANKITKKEALICGVDYIEESLKDDRFDDDLSLDSYLDLSS